MQYNQTYECVILFNSPSFESNQSIFFYSKIFLHYFLLNSIHLKIKLLSWQISIESAECMVILQQSKNTAIKKLHVMHWDYHQIV